ncbi:MAG: hydroxymethylglutaryl-CoA reductase [Candidatus Levybacteria bacterium]|nr:hydroxymethylglutaryl-CoA reductase [Candidatus Levybacteria bacterium]
MDFRGYSNVDLRRKALEKELRVKLSHIGNYSFDAKLASTKNCENMIGAVQIPLGVAGPLKLKSGELPVRNYYIPLATTEGALVASVNRGCKAICESNGANVYSYRVGATRGPVFYTGNLKNERKLYKWVKVNEDKIKKIAEKTSKHLKFKKLKFAGLGNYAFIRFSFDTGDAMGMNMATIAAQAITELIEKETGIKSLSLAGNYDVDKKASWMNFINHRGIKAWAEVVLSEKILKEILKIDSEKLFDVWLAKCMIGSAMSGSLGFNAHFANVIAAFYIATGQDPAHVVEGSLGITTMKVMPDKSLYTSVYLPSLMLGIIGGGTGLSTQKEAINLLKLDKKRSVLELAEVVAGSVLAGEISLLSSLAENSLVKAHKKFGRGENL